MRTKIWGRQEIKFGDKEGVSCWQSSGTIPQYSQRPPNCACDFMFVGSPCPCPLLLHVGRGDLQRGLLGHSSPSSRRSVCSGRISVWASMVPASATWTSRSLCIKSRPSRSWLRFHTGWRHVPAVGGRRALGCPGRSGGCSSVAPSQPRVPRSSTRRGLGRTWSRLSKIRTPWTRPSLTHRR